jgi:hypothetical protein
MLNTAIITEQYTHTQSQAPEDECIRMHSKHVEQKIKQ